MALLDGLGRPKTGSSEYTQIIEKLLASENLSAESRRSLEVSLKKLLKALSDTPATFRNLLKTSLGEMQSDFGKKLDAALRKNEKYQEARDARDKNKGMKNVLEDMLAFAKKDFELQTAIKEGLLNKKDEDNKKYLKTLADLGLREEKERYKIDREGFAGGMMHGLMNKFPALKILNRITSHAQGKAFETESVFEDRMAKSRSEVSRRYGAERDKYTQARSLGLAGKASGVVGLEDSYLNTASNIRSNSIMAQLEKIRSVDRIVNPPMKAEISSSMGGDDPGFVSALGGGKTYRGPRSKVLEAARKRGVLGESEEVLNKAALIKPVIKPSESDLLKLPAIYSEGFLYLGGILTGKGKSIESNASGSGGGLLGGLGGAAGLLGQLLPLLGVTIGVVAFAALMGKVVKDLNDNSADAKEKREIDEKLSSQENQEALRERGISYSSDSTSTVATARAAEKVVEGQGAKADVSNQAVLRDTALYGGSGTSGQVSRAVQADQLAQRALVLKEMRFTGKKTPANTRGLWWKQGEDGAYYVSKTKSMTEAWQWPFMGAEKNTLSGLAGLGSEAGVFDSTLKANKGQPTKFHGGGVIPGLGAEEVPAILKAGETVLSPTESSMYQERISKLSAATAKIEGLSMTRVEELLATLNQLTVQIGSQVVNSIQEGSSKVEAKLASPPSGTPLSNLNIRSF
jgi:hypothetical protein